MAFVIVPVAQAYFVFGVVTIFIFILQLLIRFFDCRRLLNEKLHLLADWVQSFISSVMSLSTVIGTLWYLKHYIHTWYESLVPFRLIISIILPRKSIPTAYAKKSGCPLAVRRTWVIYASPAFFSKIMMKRNCDRPSKGIEGRLPIRSLVLLLFTHILIILMSFPIAKNSLCMLS